MMKRDRNVKLSGPIRRAGTVRRAPLRALFTWVMSHQVSLGESYTFKRSSDKHLSIMVLAIHVTLQNPGFLPCGVMKQIEILEFVGGRYGLSSPIRHSPEIVVV
jgi:hypothetical protein